MRGPPRSIGLAGRYRILRRLGRGGMGAVYLAREQPPTERLVAIKVVRRDVATREVLARFAAEREALARLDHPGIGKILSAGSTRRGRAFLVLEFVAGEPITKYCDLRRSTVRERLELFAAVCDAVQHAHDKGVLHRDLKPSNVLVTEVDGAPRPVVIDFGVAKALHGRLADVTLHTQRGRLLGTPEYMSPEQASADGSDLDTRSDVYSLGVMLYELVCGMLPLPAEVRPGGLDGLREILQEFVPAAPSRRVCEADDRSRAIARARGVPLRVLQRQLRGNVDGIVLRALARRRRERYASVADLAADVRRHLSHRPVTAARLRPVARMAATARRHAGLLLMWGVAVLAVAIFGAVARSLHARALERAERLRVATNAATQAARRAAERARAAAAAEARARRALRKALEEVRVRRAGRRMEEETRRYLLRVVPPDPRTRPRRLRAGDLLRLAGSAVDPRDVGILSLVTSQGARACVEVGYFDEAIALLRCKLEEARGHRSPEPLYAAAVAQELAHVLMRAGRHREALEFLRSGLADVRAGHLRRRPEILVWAYHYAACLAVAGEVDLALRACEEAWRVALRLRGPVARETVVLLRQLVTLLARSGRRQEARYLGHWAWGLREIDVPGLARDVVDVGLVLVEVLPTKSAGRRRAIEELHRFAVTRLGSAHEVSSFVKMLLGKSLAERREFEEALQRLREAHAAAVAAGRRPAWVRFARELGTVLWRSTRNEAMPADTVKARRAEAIRLLVKAQKFDPGKRGRPFYLRYTERIARFALEQPDPRLVPFLRGELAVARKHAGPGARVTRLVRRSLVRSLEAAEELTQGQRDFLGELREQR